MVSDQPRKISIFILAMMNVAIVMSLRGLPMMAKEGLSLIFYLMFCSFLFLIPTSLISAELATGWPEGGGIYRWVKEAFGDHLGFTAIWLQWVQNVVWYPTVLAFAAGALSYTFLDPTLSESKLFNVIVILSIYWSATFLNFRGIQTSGWVSSAAVIGGTIFPGLFIIFLGILWAVQGNPLFFLTNQTFFPDLSHFSKISFLAGIILLFAGMEVSAVHANEVEDPKKNYPKAIFLAVLIVLSVFILGSLSIAAAVPEKEINLTVGIMQAFHQLLIQFHIEWMLPIVGFLIAFGAVGGVTAWIIGPSKGLLNTAKVGDIPPFLEKVNQFGVPSHILLVQGLIVTVLTLVYLLMPDVASAFFLLTALTAILYLIMYLLLFASGIRLRYTQPEVERSYKIPGGKVGMWIVAGIGMMGALFAIIVGFVPPTQLAFGSNAFYIGFLSIGVILLVSASIIMICFRKPSWKIKK